MKKTEIIGRDVLERIKRVRIKLFTNNQLVYFAISVYLLYWAIIMPVLGAIPFLISFVIGLLCLYCSRKLDAKKKDN